MIKEQVDRREFIKAISGSAAVLSALPQQAFGGSGSSNRSVQTEGGAEVPAKTPARIKFAVIGINHYHINSQVGAVLRGGGELVSVYAKEPDLVAAFLKSFPQAKLARSEDEILEDGSIQLVLSSIIPDERAPLGIRVMQHGKDYMADKPGITTLEQLAEVRRVQAETKQIYGEGGRIGEGRGHWTRGADDWPGSAPHESQGASGMVFRQAILWRGSLRPGFAPGRPVSVLHRLDRRRSGRGRGRQSVSRSIS
jgi:hypothetical protein